MKVYLAFNAVDDTSSVALGDLGYLRKWRNKMKPHHGETLNASLIIVLMTLYIANYVQMPCDALLMSPEALLTKLNANIGKSVWLWTA